MRGILAAGLVVVVTMLAGCTEEPQPRFEDPTDSPSVSESTTSAAADPEPWEKRSKAGAVAFVGMWVETFSEALLGGDTAELGEISARGCVTCDNFISRIDGVYARGGDYETGAWQVVATDVAPGGTESKHSITLRVSREGERYRERASGPVRTYPPSKATFTVDVSWTEEGWQMTRMQLFA